VWVLQDIFGLAIVSEDLNARVMVDFVTQNFQVQLRTRMEKSGVTDALATRLTDAVLCTPWM